MPRRLTPPPFGKYSIVCPYCEKQSPQTLIADLSETHCPECKKSFGIFIGTVRAKRGRTRTSGEYVVRILTRSGEAVLRFKDYTDSDLDIRSGDLVYLCYEANAFHTDKDPLILCNITTKQYVKNVISEHEKLVRILRKHR